ncbi:helix-turn-helix domain-containing protein [Bradyrhizobium diazoefficiens]|uniref:helix-turn-helix domain-containing protein n=1 Tax=Bradyrhizobium diazoefficiens TaxID=1355477 RepID=UPI00384C6CD5
MSNPRLSIIPAGAVTDRSLEPRDLQTLCLLGRHIDRAGWCTRSQVRMASEIGCGRATLQRSLDRLYEAGWVEKRRRDTWRPEDSTPSSSYAYRVKLDRDDFDLKSLARDADDVDDESHAESAEVQENGEGVPAGGQGCPPVGTGAHAYAGTGAHTYVGTKNDPLERPLKTIERDAGARARDRKDRFKAEFRERWPTSAVDDRQRTDYAADALSAEEEKAALDGVKPFLEELKRQGRKTIPSGWRYLEDKRWTLLKQGEGSAEGGASRTAFDVGGRGAPRARGAVRGGQGAAVRQRRQGDLSRQHHAAAACLWRRRRQGVLALDHQPSAGRGLAGVHWGERVRRQIAVARAPRRRGWLPCAGAMAAAQGWNVVRR